MKKLFCFSAVLALLAMLACIAIAGNVYDRDTQALSTTAGTGIWTNSAFSYSALELKRIWVHDALVTNVVLTVSRITSDLTYTQTVGTVTCSTASSGSTSSFTAAYLRYGDMLSFSSSISTGSTVMIEFEVQQH